MVRKCTGESLAKSGDGVVSGVDGEASDTVATELARRCGESRKSTCSPADHHYANRRDTHATEASAATRDTSSVWATKDDVWTLQEARCQLDARGPDGKPLIGTFPPQGYTVAAVSSGANHTLALLRPVGWTETLSGHSGLAEVWVCGSGKRVSLGLHMLRSELDSPKVFTRLDLAECLASLPEEDRRAFSGKDVEPSFVQCGWTCSYVVLATATATSEQSEVVSFGFHRDHHFGELGRPAPVDTDVGAPTDGVERCVHRVRLECLFEQVRLDADGYFEVEGIAAGLRHAIVALKYSNADYETTHAILAGWGSARHSQVGNAIKRPSTARPPDKNRRAYVPKVVWEPQRMWSAEEGGGVWHFLDLAAGRDHSIILLTKYDRGGERRVRTINFGSNYKGQLMDAPAVCFVDGDPEDLIAVSCNWTSTHVLLEAGRCYVNCERIAHAVASCGSNSKGQLGDGDARVDSWRLWGHTCRPRDRLEPQADLGRRDCRFRALSRDRRVECVQDGVWQRAYAAAREARSGH
ncbi:hypothetical protein L1887_60511 [Cichorium endivia]|nr:hypothetical protein L1887_60511 [Cichorium endivia]